MAEAVAADWERAFAEWLAPFLEALGHKTRQRWAPVYVWTSPLGLEGLLTNPGPPGGKDGGEATPTELHEGVQG